ncbi:hypothetical protein PNA2_1078 [Pyrococcus sp. NA2]|uniref:A24 family peptidase C-terminal domain-containing protein n=1 Tax=Pyrococcus sp. (strain NA2) TaxID=342949 RepID=UPI000209AA88|nr:A24 family peptidase C-terminal domain-containing protein [Pyrococcus sp. NA2]AEC51994.1 hypothetical protein PNA2_1078 [Pyrococcus sp. NA2]
MLPLILGAIVGILTSYTDIRTSYIYEEHFFPTISLISKWWCKRRGCVYETKGPYVPLVEVGILYNIILGIKHGNTLEAVSPLIGLAFGFLLGYFLYYTGGWASGDVIILASYSALLPFAPSTAKYPAPYSVILPLNSITILVTSVLLIFPLLIVYSIAGLIIKGKGRKIVEILWSGIRNVIELTLWVNASIVLLAILRIHVHIPRVLGLLLTFILILIFGKLKLLGDVLGVALLGYGIYLVGLDYIYLFAKLFLMVYAFKVLWSSVKLLRKEVLVEERSVEELNPGDVLGERIIMRDEEIVRDRSDFFEKLAKLLKGQKIESIEGEEIAGFSVEGLTEEQIAKLKELVKEGKLEDKFLVRKAMPFAPALFLGFLVSYYFGDILWWLILGFLR